jgi:hypothetical protein
MPHPSHSKAPKPSSWVDRILQIFSSGPEAPSPPSPEAEEGFFERDTQVNEESDVTPKLEGDSIPMIQTANVNAALKGVSEIEGHVASALVDYNSGMCLGSVGSGNGFDINVAAAGNTDVVRSKMKVMKALGINGGIEDILITLDSQYHLIRMINGQQGLFLYVALRRANANLAMARMALGQIEKALLQ